MARTSSSEMSNSAATRLASARRAILCGLETGAWVRNGWGTSQTPAARRAGEAGVVEEENRDVAPRIGGSAKKNCTICRERKKRKTSAGRSPPLPLALSFATTIGLGQRGGEGKGTQKEKIPLTRTMASDAKETRWTRLMEARDDEEGEEELGLSLSLGR